MTSPSKKLTGGPAFPRAGNEWSDMQWVPAPDQAGMTLRDYFAAKALPVVIAQTHDNLASDGEFFQLEPDEETGELSFEALLVARKAYGLADAMLKARDGSQ